MAGRFPIYRTEKTLPGVGPNVTGRVNFDTGAAQMAAALGRMGEAMFQVGGQMWQVQADQQYSEATAELRRKQNELQARIEANPDEDTYQEEMTRTLDEMENIPESLHLKNGLAARKFGLYLEVAKPEIENYVATKTKQRIDDKWWGTYYDRMAEAERTGNVTAFETLGKSGIGIVEGMNEKVLTPDLLKVQHNAERTFYERMAMNNPEGFLKIIKGDTIQGSKYLVPDDTVDLRQRAIAQIADNERAEQESTQSIYNDVFRQAADKNIGVQQFQADLLNTQGISEKQRTKLMQTFLAARQIWEEKGENPFAVTQDYEKLSNLLLKLQRGDPVTLKEIHDEYLSGPKGAPAFSLPDEQHLVTILAARSKTSKGYRASHPIAKQYFGGLDKLYIDPKTGAPRPKKRAEYVQKYSEIETVLKNYWDDPKTMDERIEAILKGPKEEQSKGYIRRFFGAVFETGMPLGSPRYAHKGQNAEDIDAIAGDLSISQNVKGKVVYVTKAEEMQSLPKGTIYMYRGRLYERF